MHFSRNLIYQCPFYPRFIFNCVLGHIKGTWGLMKQFEVFGSHSDHLRRLFNRRGAPIHLGTEDKAFLHKKRKRGVLAPSYGPVWHWPCGKHALPDTWVRNCWCGILAFVNAKDESSEVVHSPMWKILSHVCGLQKSFRYAPKHCLLLILLWTPLFIP